MGSLALLDVVTPYVLGGAAIGDPVHELLSALFVEHVETAFDDEGVVVAGMARFSADLTANPPRFTPPASISFGGSVAVDHRTARHAGAWWDFPDIGIRFRLTAPRASSPVVDAVTGGPGGAPPTQLASAPVGSTLAALGQGVPAVGQPAQDAPSTVFHLDLLIDAATLHLPFLTGAKLGADGMLEEDPANPEVKVTLPKIKLSFQQTAGGGGVDPQLTISLDSWAAHDIDDPAGTAFAELLRMSPPYALIGPGTTLGFGFQSLVLDLSGTETPPELLAKFGVGDDFRGIYLPDVRVFVRPPGLDGLGIDVSARELLIGIGPEGGISGIFGLDVVKPDSPQSAVVTVYDEFGQFISSTTLPDGGAPFTAGPILVPAKTQWVVDVAGGQPPYNIEVDGKTQTTEPVEVTIPAGQDGKDVAIQIEDVHAGGQSRSATFPIRLTARSLTAGSTHQGGPQGVVPTVTTPGPPGFTITFEDSPAAEKVTLVFTPPDPTSVLVGGSPVTPAGGRATVTLAHGNQIDVSATWSVAAVPASEPLTLLAQFQYAQPLETPNQVASPNDPAWDAFAGVDSNIRTREAPSNDESSPNGGWTADDHFLAQSAEFAAWKAAANANPVQPITLKGMASKEHVPLVDYNLRLSQRRIWALESLLRAHGVTNPMTEDTEGEQPASGGYLQKGRGAYRRVEATVLSGGSPAKTANAGIRLQRPPRPIIPDPFKPTVVHRQPAGTDTVRFKELHLRVQIDHNRLIAIELKLKIDVETALESYLSKVKAGNPGEVQPAGQGSTNLPVGKRADPNDGVLDIRVQVTLDDTVDRWQVVASLFEDDKDGFLQTPPPAAAGPGSASEQYWRSFFGMLVALAPLTDALAASNTPAGDAVSLAVSVAVPFAAVELDVVHVPRITLYGGELTVTHDESGTRGALLLDVEVALVVVLEIGSAKIVDTDPQNPITVRYKAVGFKTSDQPQLRDLLPVFDSSKGYTIDVPSTGGIKVPPPLGDILQVAGTRIARSNPVNLELDIELKADLGVVSVDRTTIRIPLEGGHVPTISALGVHISVPGAIDGHGYLAIYPDGFAGQLDVSLSALGLRIAAGLSVRHVVDPNDANHTATAVIVTLEVDFPVAIPLGGSGLGIYGFGGLFALHFERDEHPGDPVPALDWLQRVHGNPMDITGWVPEIDHWAIGLGAVLGTMDAGFVLNVKGAVLFELPGPRILLVMKAKILWPRPKREGDVEATILALIDIDLGRNRITIGLTFDYGIEPLLKIHVPVRAIFPFSDLEHFAIDAGTWYAPATVEFFNLFTARGYFMIRGKGIPDAEYDAAGLSSFPLPSALGGFAIATGVSVSFVWGSKSSGLYLEVGASIDVGIGFSPIIFSGELKLWGELHLWVVSVEASARLAVTAGEQGGTNVVFIDGEVHGKVDLFFFSIEGSVHVTLGDDPDSPPDPPPLVTGVTLQSRAAALLTGVSSDRPIDGKLFDAHTTGPAPVAEAVPIDSIVVIHLDCTPRVNAGAAFTTSNSAGSVSVAIATPNGPPAPAVRRGKPYYTYRITGITLDHGLTKGDAPLVWWPTEPNPSSESKGELALLSRVPDAHPSAVERSRHQDDYLHHLWGTVCDDVAPATAVLWTFHDEPLGPSTVGWVLQGTAWPDPPGSIRSVPPKLRLDVAETWRSGNDAADLLADIAPARVIGGPVVCDERCVEQRRPPQAFPFAAAREHELLAVRALVESVVAPSRSIGRGCWARVLEAPFLRHTDPDLLSDHLLRDVLTALAHAVETQRVDPLDDVVAFRTGPIVSALLLLDVPAQVLHARSLIVRCFSDLGDLIDEFVVDGSGRSRIVTSPSDLPGGWLDPGGPWHCRVREVLDYLTQANARMRAADMRLVLVDAKLKDGTAFLQTGLRDAARLDAHGLGRPSYLVGVVETLSAAEVEREQFDTTVKSSTVSTIDGALAGMPNPPALLLPSTQYTLHAAWEWTTCEVDGTVKSDATWNAGAQDFHFCSDGAPLAPRTVQPPGGGPPAVMPVRLDPWVLLSDPDEDEHFYFYGKALRVVFSVDYLLTMYETYAVKLQALVRAASNKNGPGSANHANTLTALAAAQAKPVLNAAVFSPWEDAMRGIAGSLPCVDTSGDVSRHQVLDLDLLLEPRTDYVFDIEPVNAPAPPPGGSVTPLFRRKFTTSRYRDGAELAAAVAASTLTEAPADAGAVAGLEALAGAPAPLSAAALDAALRQAGLKPVGDVPNPVVELLWVDQGGVLQPRIVVIRTPEPLARTRREPQEYEPAGTPRLQRKVITLVDRPYLEVVPTPGIAGAPTLHVVSEPGVNTIVVIVDNGRGVPIDLTLRTHANAFLGEGTAVTDTPLLAMTLDAPTWQVVD